MAVATCAATALEKRRPLPVDRIIPDPLFTSTHAITIDATPEQVWPWIATDAFVVASVDPPRDLVLTVPDGHGGHAAAWEHVLDPMADGRTRLIVRGRAASNWLDLARARPPAGRRRLLIERAYALLARLPRPLVIGFAALGHRVMEARHLRGIQRCSTASGRHVASIDHWRRFLLTCGILAPNRALRMLAALLIAVGHWREVDVWIHRLRWRALWLVAGYSLRLWLTASASAGTAVRIDDDEGA